MKCVIIFLSMLLMLADASISAQTPKVLKQRRISKWGVPPANYSGITRIGGNRYAVVSDKEEKSGFRMFTINIDPHTGRLLSVAADSLRGTRLSASRDDEGICYFPDNGTLFISGEEDQQILEYDTLGNLTGRRLEIPDMFARKNIRSNFGFESLTYDGEKKRFYTVTEGAIPYDGGSKSRNLRILAFDKTFKCVAQYAYRMEKPTLRPSNYICVQGVSELAALPDGRLVVLEREVRIPKHIFGSKVHTRLFVVEPVAANIIGESTDMNSLPESAFMKKTELAAFSTRFNGLRLNYANFEGMCLGPRLDDGRQSLLLIDDTQAGAGNSFYRLSEHIKVIIF